MIKRDFEAALSLLRSGSSNTPLSRVLGFIQNLADTSASAILVSADGTGEIMLGLGLPYAFFRRRTSNAARLADLFASPATIPDAAVHPVLGDQNFERLRAHWRWFAGVPIPLTSLPYQVTCLTMDARVDRHRSDDLLPTMAALADVMGDEIRLIGELATHLSRPGDLLLDAGSLMVSVLRSPFPMALVDGDMVVRASSHSMAALMHQERDDQLGRPIADLFNDDCDEVSAYFERRLGSDCAEETLVASATAARPAVELSAIRCTEEGSGTPLVLAVARPKPASGVAEDPLPFVGRGRGETADVTTDFLLSTLVPGKRLRRRGETEYHALARWRSPIKDSQIAALRALKRDPPATLVDQVAQQIATAATSLFGRDTARAVAAVPCGHSGAGCLSERLGRAVAERMAAPFRTPFEPLPTGGSSHPKSNTRRPPIRLARPVEEAVLLIDDVATSGVHLDQAARALRAHAPAVFPLAWIAD